MSAGLSSILLIVKACNFDSNTFFQIQNLLCLIQNPYFNVCRISKLYYVTKVPMCNSYAVPTRGVSHYGLAIYIKMNLKAKEELRKLKYFTMQIYNLQKILQKKPKSFQI